MDLNIFEKYVVACCNLYGMVEIKQVEQLFFSHNNENFDLKQLRSTQLSNNFVSIYKGTFYNDALDVDDDYKNHYEILKTKPYFEPTKVELLNYVDEDYFEYNKHYKKFEDYIRSLVDNEETVSDIVYDTHLGFVDDTDLHFTIDHIQTLGRIEFETEKDIAQLMDHLMKLQNNTRMWLNNGYTPLELRELINKRNKVGRNDLCPCGSGIKYKKCCLINK